MTVKNESPDDKKTWSDLLEEAKNFNRKPIEKDRRPNKTFVIKKCGITLDFSRQNINTRILNKLTLLAQECNLNRKISDFSNLIARSCVALLGWCYQFRTVRVNIVLEKKRCAFV